MVVSQPAGAQGAADPSISVDLDEQLFFCPTEPTTLSIPFTAQASVGVGLVLVDVKSNVTGAEYSSSTTIDSMQPTFSDTTTFELPNVRDSETWTVTATVYDSTNKSATIEKTVSFTEIADCGATGAEIKSVSMSGPVCPDPATLSVDFYAYANSGGLDRVEIIASSDANPEGFRQQVVIGDAAVTSIERTATFEIPADTPTSTWDVTVNVNDKANQMVTEVATVEVVANPGCERQKPKVTLGKLAISGPVCPDPAQLTIPFVVESNAGVVLVTASATSASGSAGVGANKNLDNPENTVDDSFVLEIPADASSGKWTVEVTAVDSLNESTTTSATVDVVANPGCDGDPLDPTDPKIEIKEVKAAGPVCADGAVVDAKIYVENVDGKVTLTGTIEGPEDFSLTGEPVTVELDGTPQTLPWSITLPATAPGGKYSLMVKAEGDTWATATASSFTVEKDADSCTDVGVTVAIEKIQVCPSHKTVTALVTASADKGLQSLVVRSDLFADAQSVPHVAGEKDVKKSVIFAIPASAKPGTYQMVAEATDATGNASLDYKDIVLGSVDDCQPIDPGGVDPNKPGGGNVTVVIPPPKPTPTPDYKKPIPTPVPPKVDPDYKKPDDIIVHPDGGKPGSLAFTGRNSIALALGGLMLIATGVAVSYDTGSRRRRTR